MKKLLRNLSVLCFVLAAFLTTGCYEEEVPFLQVDHEVVLVGPAADKGTVVVESNVQWSATSTDEWITLDNGFGNHKGTFEFFVAANTTPNERTGKIVLTSNDEVLKVTILVRQQSEGSVLTIATDEVSFTKDAGEYLMSVACNGDWEVTSSADWCKVDPTSGQGNGAFKITVDENATGADRVATISILTVADGKTEVRKVTVYQSASNAVLVVSPETKQLTAAASTFELDVITVGSWSASMDSDWLTLSETSGKGDAQITVTATKNDTGKERIAIITFATGAENENRVIRQIVVRQSAVDFYLEVPVTDYPLSLEEQTIEIPYVLEGSNVTVTASSSSKWMTVESVADGIATIKVAENTTAIAREGIISFVTHGQAGDPIIRQVRVGQAPTINLLDVLADEYAVEWVGETFRIPIYSNTPVTARSSEDWCTVAVDDKAIVITVPENTTSYPRVAVVTVTTDSDKGEILSKTTIIRQAAAYSELVVSPAEKSIYATAQSFIASIVTNNSWTASSDSDWLTIDKTNGTGDYMITVNAAENKTGRPRTAVITIQTGIENSQRESATITVTQAAEQFFLEVPVQYYPLSLAAQTIEIPYSLEGSNVTVTASSNVKWMKVTNVSDGSATVAVDENITGQAREGIITFMTLGQAGDPEVRQVLVAQAPTINILDVLADEYAVEWTGETFRIPIYTNTPVTVRSSEAWCNVSVDGQNIVITVPENMTSYPRTAVVTVTTDSESGDILSKTTIVRQAAAYSELVVSPETKNIYAIAQSFVASIVTNNSWTASSDSDWLTIDKTEGTGDYMLTVNAAKNETGQVRIAVITVQTGIENSQRESATITVTQRPEQFYFEVPTRSYLVDKWGGTIDVPYVTSGNEESVVASCNVNWMGVAEVADGIVKVTISENKTAEPRTAVVTITCTPVFGDPIAIPVTFTQSPTINILDVFVDEILASAKGDEFALPYYANTPVSVSSSEEWCHASVDVDQDSYTTGCCSYSDPQKIIKIEVDPNRTGEARVAYVTISTVSESGEKLTHVIKINQPALYAALSVTPKEVVIPAHNAAFSMTINTTGTWWATNSCNWLTQPVEGGVSTEAVGFGDAVINWTAADNTTGYDRRAQITVATGPENNEREEQVVNITQLKQDTYIYIPEEAYAISKLQQVLNVGYFAAGDFTDMQVNCSEDWIVYDSAASTEANLVFNVAENTTAEPRTAVVTVTLQRVAGEPISDSFIVTQAPTINILDAYVNAVEASPLGERFILPFYTNTTVNAVSSDPAWCHVIVNPDTDPGDLVILVDRNETAEERVAYVTLTTVTDKGEKLTHIITVTQKPLNQALVVNPEVVYLPAHDATFWLTIVTTSTWTLDYSATDWLYPSSSTGEGDDNFEVTADDNFTGKDRECTIIVWTGAENETRIEKYVKVIQLARDTYLEVPQDAFFLPKDQNDDFEVACIIAGDVKDVVVDCSESWIKHVDGAPNYLKFEVEENTTAQPRTATVTVTIDKVAGEPVTDTFTVTQAGTYNVLELLEDYIIVAAEGEEVLLPALCNVNAINKVVYADSWLSTDVTFDEANSVATITIKAAKNETGKDRLGRITYYTATGKGETISKTVRVFQPAQESYFAILSPDVIFIDHTEQDVQIVAYDNLSSSNISTVSDSGWLPFVSGTPFGTWYIAKFHAAKNDTFEQRVATVKVEYADEKGEFHFKYVTVVQAANDDYLESLVDYVVVDAAGENKTLSFMSNNAVTAVSSNPEWLEVETSGTDVTLKAKPNTTGKERTALVTVVNDKLKVLVTVFQPAADQLFAVLSPDVIQVPKAESEITLAAYANNLPEQITMVPGASWVTHTQTIPFGNINFQKFTVAKNTTGKVRSTDVKITWIDEAGDTHSGYVTIIQSATDGADLEALVDYIAVDSAGETVVLTFETEDPLTATASASWISSATIDDTVDPQTLTIVAEPNTTGKDRTAYVTVSNGSESVVITVFQPAALTDFAVTSPKVIYIDQTEQQIYLSAYASNNPEDIAFVSSSSWLAFDHRGLLGNLHFQWFNAERNTTGEERTAIVQVTYIDEKGQNHQDQITVVQAAGNLKPIVDYIVVDPDGDTQIVQFNFTGNLAIACGTASWLSGSNADPYIPGMYGLVTIVAEPNTTGKDRQSTVQILTDDNILGYITVFQPANTPAEPHFAILTPDIVNVTNKETIVDIVAYANVNADKVKMISGSPAWLTEETAPAVDASDETLINAQFKAAHNTSSEARTGVIRVTFLDENGAEVQKDITVIQAGSSIDPVLDYIVVDPAGDSQIIQFTYTGEIAVAAGTASWLSNSVVTPWAPGYNFVTIEAEPNTTGRDRTSTVQIVSDDMVIVAITVFQPAADAPEAAHYALLSGDTVNVTNKETVFDITAYASQNADKVTMISNSPAWLTQETAPAATGEIVTAQFKAAHNTSGAVRTGVITVTFLDNKGAETQKEITVVQAASSIDPVLDYIVVDPAGDSQIIQFTYTGEIAVAAGTASWLSNSVVTPWAPGYNFVTIEAEPNTTGRDRTSTVQIVSDDMVIVAITVFQPAAEAAEAAHFALLSGDIVNVTNKETVFDITAYASQNADKVTMISNSPAWLTQETAPAATGEIVTAQFKAAHNTSGAARTGNITVTFLDNKGAETQETITVVQAGSSIDPVLDYIVVDPAGDSQIIQFTYTGEIAVAAGTASWLSNSVVTPWAPGYNFVTIEAEPNTTGRDRTSTVQIVSDDMVIVAITVFQPAQNASDAQFALISPDVIHIEATTASLDIAAFGSDVDAVEDITMTPDVTWLTPGTPALSGKIVTTPFTVAENTAAEAREASVKVVYTDAAGNIQTANVLVIQAGAADDSILEALVDFVSMNPAGETMKIGFLTSEALSSAQSSSAWLTVTPGTEIIKLEAAANTTGYDRTAYVTVKTSDKTALVTVFQAAAATEFVVLTPNRAITSAAQTVPLRVYFSGEIADVADVKCSPTEPWISVEPKTLSADKHIVSIPVKATLNDTGDARMANLDITLVENGKTYAGVATIAQSPSENILDVYVSTMLVPYLATEDLLPVYSNATSVVPRSSNASWLTVALSVDASGNKDVKITIAKNETGETRTGYVTLTAKFADGTTEEKVITVVQTPEGSSASVPDYIYLALSDVTLPMAGGEKSIEVFASPGTDYTVSSSAAWLTATKGSVKLNAQPNTTGVDRTATVTVVATFPNGETETKTMSVTQKGTDDGTVANFLNLMDAITLGAAETDKEYPVNTNATSLEVSGYDTWLTVTTSGTTLKFSPAENTSTDARTTTVTVKANFGDGENQTKDIEVNQLGKTAAPVHYLNTLELIKAPVDGGAFESPVYTNANSVELGTPNGEFITDLNITADNIIEFKVATNTTGNARIGEFKVTGHFDGEDKDVIVKIEQNGRPEDGYVLNTINMITIDAGLSDAMDFPVNTNAVSITSEVTSGGAPVNWISVKTNNPQVMSVSNVTPVENFNGSRDAEIKLTATWVDGHTEEKVVGLKQFNDYEFLYLHAQEEVYALASDEADHTQPYTFPVFIQTNAPSVSFETDYAGHTEPDAIGFITIGTYDPYTGTLPVTVSPNPLNGRRKGYIKVKAVKDDEQKELSIRVEQMAQPGNENVAKVLYNGHEYLKLPNTQGGTFDLTFELSNVVNITSTGANNFATLNLSTSSPWTATVTVPENTNYEPVRMDYIDFTFTFRDGTTLVKSLPVIQPGLTDRFTLGLTEVTLADNNNAWIYIPFEYSGGTLSINNLRFENLPSWVYGPNAGGNNAQYRPAIVGKTIRLRVQRNNSGDSRNATITMVCTSLGNATAQFTITQPK